MVGEKIYHVGLSDLPHLCRLIDVNLLLVDATANTGNNWFFKHYDMPSPSNCRYTAVALLTAVTRDGVNHFEVLSYEGKIFYKTTEVPARIRELFLLYLEQGGEEVNFQDGQEKP